jgi:hypothetical protein
MIRPGMELRSLAGARAPSPGSDDARRRAESPPAHEVTFLDLARQHVRSANAVRLLRHRRAHLIGRLKVDFNMALLALATSFLCFKARRMRAYDHTGAGQLFRDLIDMPPDVAMPRTKSKSFLQARTHLSRVLTSGLISKPVAFCDGTIAAPLGPITLSDALALAIPVCMKIQDRKTNILDLDAPNSDCSTRKCSSYNIPICRCAAHQVLHNGNPPPRVRQWVS